MNSKMICVEELVMFNSAVDRIIQNIIFSNYFYDLQEQILKAGKKSL